MSAESKIKWSIGVEFYKNETEKEMDGAMMTSFELPATATPEDVKEAAKLAVNEIIEGAKAYQSSKPFIKSMESLNGKQDYVHALAGVLAGSPRGYNNILRVVEHDTYWFHVFTREEMQKQRTTMFDNSKDLEAHVNKEQSFEDIMGESSNDKLDNGGLTFTCDFYFSKTGEELNGLPDFWAIKAGLI